MTKSIIRNIFLLHAQTLMVYKFIHSQYITKWNDKYKFRDS